MLLQTAYQHPGPALVRYPRGQGPGVPPGSALVTLPWGKGEQLRTGRRVVLLAFGTLLATARRVAEDLDASLANMRFVKPLDVALVERLASEHELVVTLEENVVMGGAGSAVAEHLSAAGIHVPVVHFGLPDRFIEQASQTAQLAEAGLSVDEVTARIRDALQP
jgi:1-deoxy-D-xylulose-5-phosphate synthase